MVCFAVINDIQYFSFSCLLRGVAAPRMTYFKTINHVERVLHRALLF